ncbi:hypothetical protein SAMN02745126_04256 [Enhydrobacter aerosaccus]|uniref:Uncharacterized protein n=1 Tax=Enhydrobacter aerosaccus TaxID=225324 RepID=A0A1T4S0V2_9HYPH|nr:hypothetical protein [Enhydrobacter aerosaccus]SKA21825.1 hypothetical protein SAMN02745126_04256 [Enhydrobacter aerosaccus]
MSERTVILIRNRALEEAGGRLPPLLFARLREAVAAKTSMGNPHPSITDTQDGYALTVHVSLTVADQASARAWIMREIDKLRGAVAFDPWRTTNAKSSFLGNALGLGRGRN